METNKNLETGEIENFHQKDMCGLVWRQATHIMYYVLV